MTREYKFRGVDALTGEWLYGSLIQRKGYFPSISYNYPSGDGKISYCEAPVKAESVGQSTGFKDMNDKEIYEGDIVKDCHSFYFAGDKLTKKIRGAYDVTYDKDKREVSYYRNYVVEWGRRGSYIQRNGSDQQSLCSRCRGVEVIGNIYENKELIENHR